VPDRELKQRSLGSGVIIDKAGYIVTNYHVVRLADEITVRLMDGRELKAKVVARDPKTDLSLIKIESPAKDFPAIPLADSDKIRVGDWVLPSETLSDLLTRSPRASSARRGGSSAPGRTIISSRPMPPSIRETAAVPLSTCGAKWWGLPPPLSRPARA
jgi:hypothetical protein